MAAKVLKLTNKDTGGATIKTYRLPMHKLDATAAPTTGDDDADGYVAGSMWVDRTNNKVYVCADNGTGAAVWEIYTGRAGQGFTSTTTAGVDVKATLSSNGLSMAVPAYITTARASTDAIGLNTAQTNVTWTVNSSGISVNAGGYAGTGFTSATTAGTAIVATQNTAGLSMGVPAFLTTAAGGATISEFNPLPTLTMVSSSTLGQNSLYFQPFDLQANLYAYRLNQFVSISTSVASVTTATTAGYTMSAALYTRMTGASTDRMSLYWSGSWAITMSQGGGALSNRFTIIHPVGIANSTSVSYSTNNFASGTTNATHMASTYANASVHGYRCVPIPVSLTLTPGRYWLAVANSSTNGGLGFGTTVNVMQANSNTGIMGGSHPYFRPFGTSSAASDASYYAAGGAIGTYSATSGAFPASVALTTDAIRGDTSPICPLFNFSGYNAGTNAL